MSELAFPVHFWIVNNASFFSQNEPYYCYIDMVDRKLTLFPGGDMLESQPELTGQAITSSKEYCIHLPDDNLIFKVWTTLS